MTRNELLKIIEKYRNRSIEFESKDEEKSHEYGQFAEWLKDTIGEYEDENEEDFEDEKRLWFCFREQTEESENWDEMFPEGNDDDSITDYLTRD